jgi:hypothetical protein
MRNLHGGYVSAKDAYFSVGGVLQPGYWIIEIDMELGDSLKGKISGVADTGRKICDNRM